MDTKILVVDDDARVLQTFSRNLTLEGYHIIAAAHGQEALQLYEQEHPDIVLSDMRMPGIDGFAVLEAVRAQDPEAEVILMTGHGDSNMVIQALRAGASDFIPKPVAPVVLVAALQRAQERLRLKHELTKTQTVLRASEALFRKRATGLQTVAEINTAIATILEPEVLLQKLVDLVKQRFMLYHAHIYLLNETQDALVLLAGAGTIGRQLVAQNWQIALEQQDSLVAQVARTRQAIVVDDVCDSEVFLPNPLLPDTRTEMAVPIILGEQLLGVLDVQSDELNRFGSEDVLVQTTLASQMAIALHNAMLFAERKQAEQALRQAHATLEQQVAIRTTELRAANTSLQRRNKMLALLNYGARELNSSLNLDQVLNSLLEQARQLLGVLGYSIWLRDPATDELVCQGLLGPQSEIVRGWRLKPGQGLAGWAISHDQAAIVDDVTTDPRHFRGVDEQTGLDLHSLLTVPLRSRHSILGVIQLVDDHPGRFSQDDLDLLEPLAMAAAVAIENARLYTQAQQAITEYQQAEDTLRKFSRVVEQSPSTVVITDTDGIIEYVNPKFEQLTGYSLAEIRGSTPRQLKSGEHPLSFYVDLWNTVTTGGEWRGEFHNQKKNGELYWESASISPIRNDVGDIVYYVKVAEDITERKLMEEQLQIYAERLEQMVTEKVHELELERAKVIQAGKMAALGELATGVAHELTQPLTAINFEADYLQTLARKSQVSTDEGAPCITLNPAELDEIGKNLQGDVERCRRIVNHLRAFGRTSEERQVAVNPNQVVDNAFILIGERLKQHGVNIQHQLTEDMPDILADPFKLEQVLLNLISNAEHAMAQRATEGCKNEIASDYEKHLDIVTRMDHEDVVIEVRDNGCGIPPEVQEQIFEPFFTTKPIGQGTGLGLSISHDIVTALDGHINFESVAGKGTTFRLHFPALGSD